MNNTTLLICPKCHEKGNVNILHMIRVGMVSCSIHGEVDSQSMAAYLKAECQFPLSPGYVSIQHALSNEGST